MGGLGPGGGGSHMNHLYDDPDLTFGEMKDVLELAANADLEVLEKVDGQNLYLTINPDTGEAFAARNKTNIVSGGMSVEQVRQRWSTNPRIRDAFSKALLAFQEAVNDLTDHQRRMIFFDETGTRYTNLEVMYVKAPNIISYNANYLVMHNMQLYNPDGDPPESVPSEFNTLVSLIDGAEVDVAESMWQISGPKPIDLVKMGDGSHILAAHEKINTAMSQGGVSDSDTIAEYVMNRLRDEFVSDLNLPVHKQEALIKRMMDLPGALPAPSIAKGMPSDQRTSVLNLSKRRAGIVRKIILPLELAINDFAIEVLRALQSAFVDNPETQLRALRKKVDSAIDDLSASGDQAVLDKLALQLSKLGDVDRITSTVEGIVFEYPPGSDKIYKLTGAFAPVNQILGMVNPAFSASRKKQEESVEHNYFMPVYSG